MSVSRESRAHELFLASCEQPPELRTDFLRQACGDDEDLFIEVQTLLAYKDDEEETVVSPMVGPSAGSRFGARFATGSLIDDDRYRMGGLLGRGGMGEVYRAEDLKLGVSVALKFLPEWLESEGDMRRRFLEEVKLARAITHPNVCRVFDVGETDGHLFISMEFIDGEDLATRLEQAEPMSLMDSVDLMRQVAEGLDAAHRKGILHRDLKPSNLMIDNTGQARITDFGLAVLDGPLTGAEVMTGTPAYMAPEQLAGWEVTAQSDLYALGLVFYEMVSGRSAFPSASSLSEALRVRRETTPEAPSHLVENLDPAIEAIILRLLEENPDKRPDSVRDVIAALPGVGSPPVLMTLVTHDLVAREDEIRVLSKHHGGQEIGTGELLFERPWSAVSWALAFQQAALDQAVLDQAVGDEGLGRRVGVHLTEVTRLPGDQPRVDASALDLTRRLASLAGEGQILLTRGAFDLARQAADGSPDWLAHGAYRLTGPGEPVEVFEVGYPGQAALTAPEGSRRTPRVTLEDAILGWRPAAGQTIEARPGWRLERRLGEGGYGEVWLAFEETTKERRAFKFCFEANRLRALKREITLFHLLKEGLGDRDDIARILDWNFDSIPYFIESEYTGGGDLVEWAESQGGLSEIPLDVRLSIVAQAAEALSAAHSVGVLHKDVKPGNILVHVDAQGHPNPRLADFGIGLLTDGTKLKTPELTLLDMTSGPMTGTEGAASGTPLYRAPELLEGKTPTLQADVYALGVTLYQMVVGDFHRAVGPGWERDVDDEILREDIADTVDKSPRRRLGNAIRLAERLHELEARRRVRKAERLARAEAERAQEELRRVHRRRKVAAVAMLALAVFAGAMWWQATRVKREADRANREARTTQQVVDFILQLFEVSDPGSGHGRDVKAREILDLGAIQAQSELQEQPDVRARMMRTIGVVFRSLGLYEDAAPLLEGALAIRRDISNNEEHTDIAESLDDLAVLAREQGKYERSEALSREALDMRRRLLGNEHIDVATSLNTLAGALSQQGKYDEAEHFYQQALDMRRRLLGDEHADIAENLNSLAAMFEKKGDHEKAEPLYWNALEMRRRVLGEKHPALARSLNNLAALLVAQGDYETAEPLHREALAMREDLFGNEHPDLAFSLNNLAKLLQHQGKYEEAEPLYRAAFEIRRNLLREDHPELANSLTSLGWLRMARGDYKAAEKSHHEALTIRRHSLGTDHQKIASSLNHLAGALRAQGDLLSAEPLLREALAMQHRLWNDDEHPDIAYTLDNLAGLLEVKGDYMTAEQYYSDALELRRQLLRKDHPEIARSLILVARLRSAADDFLSAEMFIREALEILSQIHPADHWQIAEARGGLGMALAGLKQWEAAEALLLKSYQVLKKQRGQQATVTNAARKRLADFYEARGQRDKSASYRKD